MSEGTQRFRLTPITWGAFNKFFLRCKDCGCLLLKSDNSAHKNWHIFNSHKPMLSNLSDGKIK